MIRVLPFIGIVFGWFFASTFLLLITVSLFYQVGQTEKLDSLVRDISTEIGANNQIYNPERPATMDLITAITSGDARAVLVDRYLRKYRSPMAGAGEHFVRIADKYDLDYRLLPAIAQKESGLGRVIPNGSYNAWGWAIYSGKNSGAEFDSWEHAIETVARGMKANYIDKGLKTPTEIMTKYTPSSDGSWAEDVLFTMNQIETGS
jgi:hypothetical protein